MGSEDASSEHRDKERAPIELKVEYRRLNTFFADYTKNISRGGTFVATTKPLPVETEFVFALGIPGLEEPLRLLGKVIWTTSEDDATPANPAGMGIEFQYRDEKERLDKERLVEVLMCEQLGELLSTRLLGRPPHAME